MADIRTWLDGLGLERYADVFEANDIDLDVLPHLTEAQLDRLGVSIGHGIKILEAAKQPEAAPAAAPAATPEAERRQLSVMFCDLVGSTALSERLDPEELHSVMQGYRKACSDVIERYDGHVAQYLGDGVMVYFGWPRAHEDDAQRAVRAGLDIVEAVAAVDSEAELAVRVGIATGLVVVGEQSGDDTADAKLAVGETPNIAARVQALAEAGSVAVAQSTRRLLGGVFEMAELGEHELKGVSGRMALHRVVGESRADSRFAAAHGLGLTPLVGRENEISLLLERWDQAKDGEGQVALLEGEAGIGKSRVTEVLRQRLADEAHTRLRYQGSPYYTNSAFYPINTQFEHAAGFEREDGPEIRLDKLEAVIGDEAAWPLFAAMLSLPLERYPPLNLEPGKQKEETIAALAAEIEALARSKPVLMIFEDAHWYDPTTLEALAAIIERIGGAPVLAVITYRPEFEPPWSGHGHLTNISLNRLSRRQGADMVAKVTGGKAFPDEVLDQIVAKTDGVPLFVEELTKTVLEAGFLEEREDAFVLAGPLPPLAIPATLQDSLMARLDRLSPVKEVAQIGACIGREFSFELIAAVSPLRDNELQDSLTQLTNSELIFRRGNPPDATYTFKHALVQDTAYESLLKSKRQQLHTTIANTLVERFPDLVDLDPGLVAHHYTRAGLNEQAIPLWLAAGERSIARFANVEAENYAQNGLQCLAPLPEDGERDTLEIALQVVRGIALLSIKGYGAEDVGDTFSRARVLCDRVGETPYMFPVLHGLWMFHMMRAEYGKAANVADHCLSLAQQADDSAALMLGHWIVGGTALFEGKFEIGLQHSQEGASAYDNENHRNLALIYGHNPAPTCMDWMAWAQWTLGYSDKYLAIDDDAVTLARDIGHPLTLVTVIVHAAIWAAFNRDVDRALTFAREAISLSNEHGIPLRRIEGEFMEGWALAELGEADRAVTEIEDAIVAWRAMGADIGLSWWLAFLAEAKYHAGHPEAALLALQEGLDFAEKTNERSYEAELHRLRGVMLDACGEDSAEECFTKAVAVAREQKAKFWELRAATSLARLWQSQNKAREAHDLMAPVYGWFTEGFDTADLKDAKALLDELG